MFRLIPVSAADHYNGWVRTSMTAETQTCMAKSDIKLLAACKVEPRSFTSECDESVAARFWVLDYLMCVPASEGGFARS
jgi:hypothetical protein